MSVAVQIDASRQPVVFVRDGETFANSRDVAAAFEKDHKNVLRDIRNLHCSDDFRRRNFEPFRINDLTGESVSHVDMTRDGFVFLVMGFTGQRAAMWKERYISAFNAMEAQLRKSSDDVATFLNDPRRLRAALADYSEKVTVLQEKVEALEPKALAFDRIEGAEGSMCISTAAKTLNKRPKELFAFLQARKWIFKRAGSANWIAYQDKIQAGLMEHADHQYQDSQGRTMIATRALVTAKGLSWLAGMLNEWEQ